MKRALLSGLAAAAMALPAAHADEAAVRATILRLFPGNPAASIQPSPVNALFEAVIDGQVYYFSADGHYVLGGPLVDTVSRMNLTEARLQKINAIAWDTLPLDLAIKRVKGAGTRRIAIFEDPDCPYCKTLERTLAAMDDLTIYVLLFPIDDLHPQAAAKSRAIWCAKNPSEAWDMAMRTGAVRAAPECKDPIGSIADFARRHRINGTPTSVLADGSRLVGAVPRDQLEAELKRATSPGGRKP